MIRSARGKADKHHITYELDLADGRVLRTRISRPADKTSYGAALWAFILREQLDTTEGEFWACVRSKTPPNRGSTPTPSATVSADIIFQLIRAGLPETQIKTMTKRQAIEALNEYWNRPQP